MKVEFKEKYGLYIGGEWRDASDGATFETTNPANGEHLAYCAEATKEDVDAAVKAAWKAFPAWKAVEPQDRAAILNKIADRILVSDCPECTLERLKDDRKFCIDPERLKTVDESTKSIMRNKGKRFASYLEIREKYDESKSKSENAVICGVSDSTIARFRRNRAQMEQLCRSYFGL
jgi:hypothetical protein